MTHYRRPDSEGATWFFTVVTYQRRSFLCDREVRASLREAITRTRTSYPFRINAWVLLPDHFHCIWTLPENDSNFQLRIRLIKRHVTLKCSELLHDDKLNTPSRRKRNESTIWQRRFWEHQILSDEDFQHHMDYIHYNPVKHGLSQSAIEWPYSTFHQLVSREIYPRDWASNPEDHETKTYGE